MSKAAQNGHEELVKLLLARNDIDVNAGRLLGLAADQDFKPLMVLLSM